MLIKLSRYGRDTRRSAIASEDSDGWEKEQDAGFPKHLRDCFAESFDVERRLLVDIGKELLL
jgi:hypothetical protein